MEGPILTVQLPLKCVFKTQIAVFSFKMKIQCACNIRDLLQVHFSVLFSNIIMY